jgi:hypothetical protein
MPLPLLAIGVGLMAAAGAAKTVHGISQANQAKRMAKNNVRPDYKIEDEYYDNLRLANNMAQSGLGAPALNYYTSNAERGLSSTTGAMLQAGGGPNSILGAYDSFNRNLGAIAATDSQLKTQNIRYYMDRNKDVAEQKTMRWSLNEYEPYKDTARTASALRATGTENAFGGISQIGGALAAGSKAGLFSGDGGDGGGGGASPEDTAITTVRPSAVITPPSVSGNGPGLAYVDDALRGYENSPYYDLVKKRLLNNYGATA